MYPDRCVPSFTQFSDSQSGGKEEEGGVNTKKLCKFYDGCKIELKWRRD